MDDNKYEYEINLLENKLIMKHNIRISDSSKLKKYIRLNKINKLTKLGFNMTDYKICPIKDKRDFYIRCIPYMVENSSDNNRKILGRMLYIDNKGTVMPTICSTLYLGISSSIFIYFYTALFEEINIVKICSTLFFYVIMICGGYVFIKSTIKDNNSNYYFTDEFELDYLHKYLFEDQKYHNDIIANSENNIYT